MIGAGQFVEWINNNAIENVTGLLYKDNHTERIEDLYGTEAKPVLGNKVIGGDDQG